MQPDGQLCDLTDPLLLLRDCGPHKLLKLPVENRDGVGTAALSGEPSHPVNGGASLLAPELVLRVGERGGQALKILLLLLLDKGEVLRRC